MPGEHTRPLLQLQTRLQAMERRCKEREGAGFLILRVMLSNNAPGPMIVYSVEENVLSSQEQ